MRSPLVDRERLLLRAGVVEVVGQPERAGVAALLQLLDDDGALAGREPLGLDGLLLGPLELERRHRALIELEADRHLGPADLGAERADRLLDLVLSDDERGAHEALVRLAVVLVATRVREGLPEGVALLEDVGVPLLRLVRPR